MDLVSVIIPVYNAQKYIEKCVESIINQSYENLQILLIDDGSKDESLNVCKSLAEKDARIEIIEQKNSGVSKARNAGLKRALGKWIVFVDADDWIEEHYIEMLHSECVQGVDFVIGDHTVEETDGNAMPKHSFDREFILDNSSKIACLERVCVMPRLKVDELPSTSDFLAGVWGKIYSNDVIQKGEIVFPVGLRISEDVLFNVMYLENCKKVKYCRHNGYHYVSSDTSVMRKHFPEKFECYMKYIDYLRKSVDDNQIRNICELDIRAVTIREFYTLVSSNYYMEISKNILEAARCLKLDVENYNICTILKSKEKLFYVDKRHKMLVKLLQFKLYTITVVLMNFKNRTA